MAVLLALMHIADMHLHDGAMERADAVEQGDARVGVGTGVEHDARTVGGEAHLLHLVDELALDVALVIAELHIGEEPLQLREVCLEAAVPVDAGLTHAQHIKIGTVYYLNLSHFCEQIINFDTKLKIKRDIAKENRQ